MVALMSWSYQIEPHPFATVLRRVGIVTLATWVLLTASLAAASAIAGCIAAPDMMSDLGGLL